MKKIMPKEKVEKYLDDLLIELEITKDKKIMKKIINTYSCFREYFGDEEIERYKNLGNKILGDDINSSLYIILTEKDIVKE